MERSRDLVGVGLAAFALINLITALFAVVDPGAFYDEVGPFGPQNDHYIRDAAGAMIGSLGVAMAIAVFKRSWRVGVLGYGLLQYSFHALNHLADIGEAEPERYGPIDFVALSLSVPLLAWLLIRAAREERAT